MGVYAQKKIIFLLRLIVIFFIKKRNFYSFLRSIELREYNEISSDIEQIGHYQRYITVCMSVFWFQV